MGRIAARQQIWILLSNKMLFGCFLYKLQVIPNSNHKHCLRVATKQLFWNHSHPTGRDGFEEWKRAGAGLKSLPLGRGV